MKVFITASSGVGKTAVVNELVSRGYTAYDVDDRDLNLTRLELTETGETVEWPEGYIDWHLYSWNANEERLKELLATDETVFVSGIMGNQAKLYHNFDKLIALTIDPVEHERRLRTRPKREVGDHELNIRRRLDRYASHMANFIADGFVTVDNTGSVQATADKIQKLIAE